MKGIPGYETFSKIIPLDKGMSGDEKYYIETTDGRRLLLRVSDIAERSRKENEFAMMRRVDTLGVPMSRPLAFGECADKQHTYTLCTWCDGTDLEALLPTPRADRYAYGIQSGRLLRRMHQLPVESACQPWPERFGQKVDSCLAYFADVGTALPGLDIVLAYVRAHRHIVDARPQRFAHGDYNLGNMIATPDGRLGIIDFNYYNLAYGDPWRELCVVAWGTDADPDFFTGQINGYFENEPPPDFFPVLALYHAFDAACAVWNTANGEEGPPEDGEKHLAHVLAWYDHMRTTIPVWYRPISSP